MRTLADIKYTSSHHLLSEIREKAPSFPLPALDKLFNILLRKQRDPRAGISAIIFKCLNIIVVDAKLLWTSGSYELTQLCRINVCKNFYLEHGYIVEVCTNPIFWSEQISDFGNFKRSNIGTLWHKLFFPDILELGCAQMFLLDVILDMFLFCPTILT